MNCDHDIVEVTTVGDTFHRGLCIKCNTRFIGPQVVVGRFLEGGPWKTYEARGIRPVYLTESEFEVLRDVAANRAAALGISEEQAIETLLDIIRKQSPLMLDNMGLRPGQGSIIRQLIANAQEIDGDGATSGTGGADGDDFLPPSAPPSPSSTRRGKSTQPPPR